ncbi:MAG: hemerythrin domain-containing protein [Thermodesulfovibrionales bacterium]
MDILEFLRQDHEAVLSLFDKLNQMKGKTSKDGDKDRVFEKLKEALELHTAGEEEFFYPPFREDEDLRPMALKAIEEHHVAKLLLTELSGMQKDEYWDAKLSVLKESVEQHIEEEEEDIFANAQEMFGTEQRNEMGKKVAEMKKAQPAGRR